MAQVQASGSISPRPLQRTISACTRDFGKVRREWQDSYPGFKERLPDDQRARLKEVGRLMWCFDIRFRWATGVTAIEFDDEVVTTATAAPTKEGYFLLMRLVDLWFSCDLAFEMYKRMIVRKSIENPNFLLILKHDALKTLRPAMAATEATNQTIQERIQKPAARERLVGYLEGLERDSTRTVAAEHLAYALRDFQRGNPLKPHHLGAIAQAIRNRYVHGGETASTGTFSAQEKVPLLKLLCGYTQVLALSVATAAGAELNRQLRLHARM